MSGPHRITVHIDDGAIAFVSPQALGVYVESAEFIRAPSPELVERLRIAWANYNAAGDFKRKALCWAEIGQLLPDLLEHYEGTDHE